MVHVKFFLIDLCFGFVSLFSTPYRGWRKFLQKKGAENIYAYGETPFSTYERIAKECGILPEDTWVELGAGRGRGCFWLKTFIGCKVIGVEWIYQFVWIANLIKKLFQIKNLEFIHSDISKVDLSEASVIYLYGIDLDLQVKKNVRVITISEPIEGYQVIKKFWVRYPWGRTTAFLQIPLSIALLTISP